MQHDGSMLLRSLYARYGHLPAEGTRRWREVGLVMSVAAAVPG